MTKKDTLKELTKETKKRKYVEDIRRTTKKKKETPFWWKDEFKDFLKVEKKIDKNEANGKISWTKKYISKSNWKTPIIFDNSNVKEKEKKKTVHKTSLSKKELDSDEIVRSRKILLRPTKEQKKIIQQWMRISRFVYNITCRYVKKNKVGDPNFTNLKSILLNEKKNPDSKKYPWLFKKELKNCPRDAKDSAIQEFVSAVHSSKEMLKEKQKKLNKKINLIPNMKERSQNDHQRVVIQKNGGKPVLNGLTMKMIQKIMDLYFGQHILEKLK